MKFLYLLKEKNSLTGSLKEIMDAQVADGNDVSEVRLYEGNIDYDELMDSIFTYDRVICF